MINYRTLFQKIKHLAFFIAIANFIFLMGCHSDTDSVRKDDTTAVLKILLDSALHENGLARAAQLKLSKPFGDTTVFLYNKTLMGHLPKDLPHKLLTEDEICHLMTISNKTDLQFLELDEFVKTSTGYRVALGTHCMWRGAIQNYRHTTSKWICERQKYCNAILNMDLVKHGDNITGGKAIVAIY